MSLNRVKQRVTPLSEPKNSGTGARKIDPTKDPVGLGFLKDFKHENYLRFVKMLRDAASKLPKFKDGTVDPRAVLASLSVEDQKAFDNFSNAIYRDRVKGVEKTPDHLVGTECNVGPVIVNYGCGRRPQEVLGVVNYDPFHPMVAKSEVVIEKSALYSVDVMVDCKRMQNNDAFQYHLGPNHDVWVKRHHMSCVGMCGDCGCYKYTHQSAIRTSSTLVIGDECDLSPKFDYSEKITDYQVMMNFPPLHVRLDCPLDVTGEIKLKSYCRPAHPSDMVNAGWYYPKLDGELVNLELDFKLGIARLKTTVNTTMWSLGSDGIRDLRILIVGEMIGTTIYCLQYVVNGVKIIMTPNVIDFMQMQLSVCGPGDQKWFQGLRGERYSVESRPISKADVSSLEGIICVNRRTGEHTYVKSVVRRSVDLNNDAIKILSVALSRKGVVLHADPKPFEGVREFILRVIGPKVFLDYYRDRDKKYPDKLAKSLQMVQNGTLEDYICNSSSGDRDISQVNLIGGYLYHRGHRIHLLFGMPNTFVQYDGKIKLLSQFTEMEQRKVEEEIKNKWQ